MTAKELQEKRNELNSRIQELRTNYNDGDTAGFSAEDQTNWDSLNADFDALSDEIEVAQRAERAASLVTDPATTDLIIPGRDDTISRDLTPVGGPGPEARGLAIVGWMRSQADMDVTPEMVTAARTCGINLNRKTLEIPLGRQAPRSLQEARDLSAVTAASGGVLNPDGFVPALERNLLAFGGMRQEAEIIRTDRGDTIAWPTADDTSNTGEQLGEGASIGSSVDGTFGAVMFGAYKFSSKLVKVPSELLEDSIVDVLTLVGGWLGERLGRIQNTKYTTGTGASTPKGIVTAATAGVTTASSTAITYDELLDLLYSVDEAYAANAKWMMHRLIIKVLRKIQDGDGRPIWSPSLMAGEPEILLGHPVVKNSDMSSTITSGDVTMLFGDISKYKIREVRGIRMKRLVERYADTDQEGFVAFLRGDGNLVDAGTAPVKKMTQA